MAGSGITPMSEGDAPGQPAIHNYSSVEAEIAAGIDDMRLMLRELVAAVRALRAEVAARNREQAKGVSGE